VRRCENVTSVDERSAAVEKHRRAVVAKVSEQSHVRKFTDLSYFTANNIFYGGTSSTFAFIFQWFPSS
jgi:hypothetical protein